MIKKREIKSRPKKRKAPPQELRQLKEQQKLLYLRQRRKVKKRQLLLLRIKGLLRFGSVIFIFLAALYTLLIPQWKLSPFVFASYPNKNLVLKDNSIASDSQIINQLKNFNIPDKPIYLLNTKPFEKAVKELDPVEQVHVRRYWLPARLIFTIKEKQPLFLVYDNVDTLPSYAVTTDGSIIRKKFLPLPDKYDKEIFKLIISDKSLKWDEKLIDKYEKIARIAVKTTHEELEYIDLRNKSDVYIVMSKSLIRLGEIDATSVDRIVRLKAVIPSIRKIEDSIEYIDLRWDNALSLKEKVKSNKKAAAQDTSSVNPDPAKAKQNTKEDEKRAALLINIE